MENRSDLDLRQDLAGLLEFENAIKIAGDDLADALDDIVGSLGLSSLDFETEDDSDEVVVDKSEFFAAQRDCDDAGSDAKDALNNFRWVVERELRQLRKGLRR